MHIFAAEGGEATVLAADQSQQLLVLALLALPILGAGLTALFGRRMAERPWLIAVTLVIVTWAIASWLAWQALVEGAFGEHGIGFTLYEWIPAGAFRVDASFLVDNLTAVMLVVVTTIGMLVHVYSVGYMAHDPGRWRFFAYLNFFMFSMLLLVLASNFLVIFVAWELVGISSYLLIGFWYRKRTAALAAKKAFLVNRVGDLGLSLAIMAIWTTVGTLDTTKVFTLLPEALRAGHIEEWMMIGICLLLFAGAMGKSAQFPLHVWLPDAMEGPTPVSALIHAATMVNAGVYLVARSSPLFSTVPAAMVVVAAIGIFTSILAASIAFTQTDIKRVLAYSTLSQLGLMFAALGVGAYIAAIFHLVTHGFFKGLLFLGSGSVIHAMHEEQDMRHMGALSSRIRWTYGTMLVGTLAIAGIPPLAGFFSKDEILGESFKLGFWWVWAIGIVVAFMTAFYMFRLMGLTFWGSFRGPRTLWDRIHESPWVMVVPLVLLAIPSALLGIVLGLPLGDSRFKSWLEPVFHQAEVTLGHTAKGFEIWGVDGALIVVSVIVATVGMVAAWWLFGVRWLVFRRDPQPARVAAMTDSGPLSRRLYVGSLRKWYFDDLNDRVFVRFGGRLADAVAWFDVRVIDGTVNGVAAATQGAGRGIRHVQTGRVQNYALGIAVGLIVVAFAYLLLAAR